MTRRESAGARRIDLKPAQFDGRFTDANYARGFGVEIADPGARSPEQWVRDIFEAAPRVLRWALLAGWRGGLGLRLGPLRSPAHVLGWRIDDRSPDSIHLQVESALMTAHKVLLQDDSRLMLATFIYFKQPWAQFIWAAAAPIHHQTEPYLLRRAARSGEPPTV